MALRRIDAVVRRVMKSTRVVPRGLHEAVGAAARECWSGLDVDAVEVGDFKRGVLHIVVDSHARLGEARSFYADGFREMVNAHLAATGSHYVTKLVFHVRGTYE